MQLPLIYYGNPILRKKTAQVTEITDEIRTLVRNMIDTVKANPSWGIAAPQVGRSLAIFVAHAPTFDQEGHFVSDGPLRVFINPRLTNPSNELWIHSESCMSIPKLSGNVARPISITITAQDIDGKEFTEHREGWPARVVMHENDHINGVLYIDRVPPQERKKLEPKLIAIKKQYNS